MAFRIAVAVGITMVALNASVRSQDLDFGKTEFLSKCAECHGADGKGAGPLSATIKPKPANLTILAKRNNDVFAADAVYKRIDGRDTKTSHGSSEMPIWGCRHLSPPAFSPTVVHRWFFSTHHAGLKKVKKPTADPLESFEDLSCDPETVIQERIQAIVEYLRQIQEK
jgi:Cytochrome c